MKELEIKKIPTDRIKTNPDNSNYMTLEQKIKLRKSIEKYGFLQPVLVKEVGEDYEIVDGEHRFFALQDLNYTEIPCIVIDCADDINLLQVSINTIRGQQNLEKLSVVILKLKENGYDKDLLVDLLDVPEKFIRKILNSTSNPSLSVLDENDMLKGDFMNNSVTSFTIYISTEKFKNYKEELDMLYNEVKKKLGEDDLMVTKFNIEQLKEAFASLDVSSNSLRLSVLFNLLIDKYFELKNGIQKDKGEL